MVQIFYFKNLGQGHWVEHSQWYHSMANIKNLSVVSRIFALAPIVSKILTFQMCVFANLGQGHEVQHLQRRHLIGYTKFYKRHWTIFALALTVSEILTFHVFDLENLDQGHVTWWKILNSKSFTKHFYASFHCFRHINIKKLLALKM